MDEVKVEECQGERGDQDQQTNHSGEMVTVHIQGVDEDSTGYGHDVGKAGMGRSKGKTSMKSAKGKGKLRLLESILDLSDNMQLRACFFLPAL